MTNRLRASSTELDAAREDLLAFTGFPNLKAERPDWLEREQAVKAEVRRRNSASSSSASSPDSRDASGRAHRRSQGRPRIKAGKRRSPGPDRHRSGHASTADSTDGYFLVRGALAAGDGTHQV
ncbi:hypothetical protein AB0C21_05365 [Spirillospora sp. NPDC049024]